MTDQEYYHLQDELSKLLRPERINAKLPLDKYRSTYKEAVMDCKSKLHEIHNFQKRGASK